MSPARASCAYCVLGHPILSEHTRAAMCTRCTTCVQDARSWYTRSRCVLRGERQSEREREERYETENGRASTLFYTMLSLRRNKIMSGVTFLTRVICEKLKIKNFFVLVIYDDIIFFMSVTKRCLCRPRMPSARQANKRFTNYSVRSRHFEVIVLFSLFN